MGSKWRHVLVLSTVLSAALLLTTVSASAQPPSGAAQVTTPTPVQTATPRLTPAATLVIPRFPLPPGQVRTPTPVRTPTAAEGPSPTATADATTPTPTGTATATPPSGAEPSPGAALAGTPEPGGPLSGDYEADLLRGYRQFDTYEIRTTIRWVLEDGGRGTAAIDTAVRNDPPAQYWDVTLTEVGRPSRRLEIVRRGGTNYLRVGQAWQPLPESAATLLRRVRWATRPQELLDLTRGRFVGVRTVNGLRSEYYRYRADAFSPAQEHVELTNAQADLYVSREPDVVTRLRIRATGRDALGNAGVFDMVTNLVRVDAEVEIPEPTVAAGVAPETGARLVLPSALNLESLDSFRVLATVDAAVGLAPRGLAIIEARVSDDPPAEHLSIEVTTGLLGLRQRVEYLNVEGSAYLLQAGRWRAVEGLPAQLLEEFSWVARPSAYLRLDEGELVSEGTLRGEEVRQYHYDLEDFSELTLLERIDEASADLWLATEHEIYTRIEVSLRGRDAQGQPAVYRIDANVLDVNEPVEIERPADLPEAAPEG